MPNRRFALTCLTLALALTLATPVTAQLSHQAEAICLAPIDPIPSGLTRQPGDSFNSEPDYRWAHSSTHLQGKRSTNKWAWGFFLPTAGSPAPLFSDFRTVVIVNNPSPTASITVRIEYRNLAGTLMATNVRTIAAEGFWNELATPLSTGAGANGLGSIRVVSQAGSGPFVAATVHHAYRFNGVLDTEPDAPMEARHPGLASMQQFQERANGSATLRGGPYPTTSDGSATHVSLAGLLPVFQLINPSNATNTVDIFYRGAISGITATATVILPPFGSHIDTLLLNALFNPSTNAYLANFHDDVVVTATSREGLPLLGEQLALDFYDASLTPFERFRMASSMMASATSPILINPELTQSSGAGPTVNTISMIANFSNREIGPVVIEYRDARTGTFTTDLINPFPAGRTQRIAPGEPGIVNYPLGTWDGNIRIRACRSGLVGWTMREVEPAQFGGQQFHKLYGESLDGANKTEPGQGFTVNTLGQNRIRKVAPLDRCAANGDSINFWPSYTTFANLGNSANVGNYYYRFFQPSGAEVTDFTLQPFAGVRWGANSFTFEDGNNRTCFPLFAPRETSGRVDHSDGRIVGIDVIGDPLSEWSLGIPNPPVYTGPGDVVPLEPPRGGGSPGGGLFP